jgi:hypothetical protein
MGPSFMSFAELYEHVTQVCGTAEAAQKDILLRLERGDLVAFATKEPKSLSNQHFSIAKNYWCIAQIAWDKLDEPIRFRQSHWPPEMGSEVIGVYVERKDALRLWPRSIVTDVLRMFVSSPRDELSPPIEANDEGGTEQQTDVTPRLPQGALNIKPIGAGGAPQKYDWPKAAGYMTAYLVENDYPDEQAHLVRLMLDWFKNEHGKAPDKRDVERFVKEAYEWRGRKT